jgi:hypothetical protein
MEFRDQREGGEGCVDRAHFNVQPKIAFGYIYLILTRHKFPQCCREKVGITEVIGMFNGSPLELTASNAGGKVSCSPLGRHCLIHPPFPQLASLYLPLHICSSVDQALMTYFFINCSVFVDD